MKKSKIYFAIGIMLFQFGACLIHRGLGIMLFGALILFYSYLEFEENHEDKKEEE